ncbi:Protein of unknown function (DUF1295) [Geosmithia morbida]|uniref:NAD(P)-binding domain-containing protein n=1 Tax=Geosmithia morbida TaxID=1094350 RepID=A0A9P5D4K8_9HYPO|nr:Protein of unknown function (DUF1295) [Geosmithia morbida]KAF4126167.1 Protein of unknown function (DUF1295) [Geosmithia morbida]
MTVTVGIAGITGKFGRLLASHLLKNPSVELRGYCRNAANVPAFITGANVKIFEGGAFDSQAVRPFVEGCDVVACAYLGDDKLMVDGQKVLIDSCEENKVPRYIASDYSVDFTKLELGQLFPKDPMKHVKAYLDTKQNVKGVHVLIGGFMETLTSPFFGLYDARGPTFRYWGDGTEVFEASTYENAAEYTAAVAADTSAVGKQHFLGGAASAKDLAKIFEEVHGIKPKLESLGTQEELYTKMTALRAQYPNDIFKYMALYYTYYMISGKSLVGPRLDNDKYPNVKPFTWTDFIKQLPVSK